MIKPEELRIGNWAYDTVDKTNIALSLSDFRRQILEYLEPIPVTEEWLDKFGFYTKTKYPNGHITSPCCDYAIRHNERLNSWYWFNHSEVNGTVDWIRTFHIKHIHQIQNLYFALTGEELEVK